MEKKAICVNEYKKEGSCRKKGDCNFRHSISIEERNSAKMQVEVQKKWERITGLDVNKQTPRNIEKEELLSYMKVIKEMYDKMCHP